MYSQRPFEWYLTRLSKLKISWRRRKQYTSPRYTRGRHKNKSKFNFDLFEKKIKFLSFHGVLLVKTFQLSRTDIDEAMAISFLGVRTDRHGFGILTWKHVGTQKISTQSSKLVVSRRWLYASPEDGDA